MSKSLPFVTATLTAIPRVRRLVDHCDHLVTQNEQLLAAVELLTDEREAAEARAGQLASALRRLPAMDAESATDLDYLFIVTYGRSGSTLLMGLLDAIPGYCIRGENGGVLYKLFEYHSTAAKFCAKWTTDNPLPPQHPWYGIDDYPDDLATLRMRQLVVDTLLRPEPGTRVTGFKEIRWWMQEPFEYIDFIESLFPKARFVLNTRNLDDVAKSSWWHKEPNARGDLAKIEDRLKAAVGLRGDRGYHVHYDDYIKDPAVLRELFEWLDEKYDADRIASILAIRHST
ncbi:sulfotransferase [Actinopolymorpha sp. B17G11]|uniref:sulfotransferase n=1 Tax=unclassified Actinopolymorpha TaxID=2627063 RepID=UPI0032D8DB89